MSELPITCQSCLEENMIDMENLNSRTANKVVTILGQYCSKCGRWITISYTTLSLDMALMKLASRSTQSIGYHWHFAKTLKKAQGVQERYGTF